MRNSGSTMRHDETTVTVAGEPVRCYRAGPGDGVGPALVLLHGGGLDSAQAAWAPVWSALTPHARLVAPDLPGYGGSLPGTTEPTLEVYRTWLLGFLDACQIGRATIAGLAPCGVSRGELAKIACPALLLSGARDRLVPPGDVRAAAERIPGGRFVLVPGAGHRLPRDAPRQVAEELVACLASTGAADDR
jgi:pimeloyl-ACP methyl ester carboxylesterase